MPARGDGSAKKTAREAARREKAEGKARHANATAKASEPASSSPVGPRSVSIPAPGRNHL
jgi:hypothetical protein